MNVTCLAARNVESRFGKLAFGNLAIGNFPIMRSATFHPLRCNLSSSESSVCVSHRKIYLVFRVLGPKPQNLGPPKSRLETFVMLLLQMMSKSETFLREQT